VETVVEEASTEEPPKPWEPAVRRWWLPITVLTVALEIAVVLRLGLHWSTLPVALFASTAVVLALIDFAVLRLPNVFTETTALAVCAALAAQALAEHRPHHMLSELYGGLATGLFYQLMRLLSRGGLGVGDVKVGAVAGALLAARGVQPVFDGLLVAWLVTVAVALAMMTRRKKQFPYGPGILLGALFVLLV
jgi:leader peptidase (prepilin peptidase)/N-methyltransferase